MVRRFAALILSFFLGASAYAATPSADAVLQQSRTRPDGSDVYSEVDLILVDDQGRKRTRKMYYLQKDYGPDEKLTLYFTDPTDVRGVSFQIVNYDEAKGKEDDQWLYLPAFRQVRRIATADKRGAFMGSEFAYIDLEKLRVGDYQQTLRGEEPVNGRDCWVVERTPASEAIVNKTGYHKTITWVDKESRVVLKQTFYDAKGVMFKMMTVRQFEKVQGIWTVIRADMEDLITKKSSSLVFSNTRYDVGLDDNLFKQAILKTGVTSDKLPATR